MPAFLPAFALLVLGHTCSQHLPPPSHPPFPTLAATSKSLHAVLGRYGALTDAAVFPARIGPLGYAFVKFERIEDAVRAFEALNNTVVPPLSGSKQLKMRYKPANDGPVGRGGDDPSDPCKGAPKCSVRCPSVVFFAAAALTALLSCRPVARSSRLLPFPVLTRLPPAPFPSLAPPSAALMVPSRHLWLGNITQKPTDDQVLEVFATFGKVDSGA